LSDTFREQLQTSLGGDYRLERELGHGGMALVYVAEDLRHHRRVAIKVLRPELGAAVSGERFLREIEIAASLRHPHISPLFDSGDADGLLYYVMPLIEGETLRARLERERQLPIDDALRFAHELADALSYAHAKGVIHRDIKPENVLIEHGRPVLVDFGIAKALGPDGTASALTGTGISIGTPAYMSPEQAAGGGDEVDGRSDLYSLACLVYEMLAGQPPFTGATTETLVRQHIVAPLPPVAQFRPTVPAHVGAALARALAKAPADRFATVERFSAALEPPRSMSRSAPPEGKRTAWWRRTTVMAGALVLVLGTAWAMREWDRSPASSGVSVAPSLAILPFDNLSGDTAIVPLIVGMHAEMVTQLTKLGGLTIASRHAALEYQNSGKPDRQIAAELGVGALLRGSVQRAGDQVRISVTLTGAPNGKGLWADSYDRRYTAANLFELQGDIAREVANALQVQLTEGERRQIAKVQTTSLPALDLYYRAIALRTNTVRENDSLVVALLERAVTLDPSFVSAWRLLAQTHGEQLARAETNDTLPAWKAVQRAQALAPGSLDAVLAHGYYRYYVHGDFAGALADLEGANRLMPNASEILLPMSGLKRHLGKPADAVALLERAVKLDPRNAGLLSDLGAHYAAAGRYADAQRAFDSSLAILPQGTGTILTKLYTLWAVGDTAGARRFYRSVAPLLPAGNRAYLEGHMALLARDLPRALEGSRAAPPYFNSPFSHGALTLALIARASGDSTLAHRYADSVLADGRRELPRRPLRGNHDPFGKRVTVEAQMAVALAIRGRRDEAVRLAEASAERYGIAQDAINGGGVEHFLALTYMLVGRRADAVAALERVVRSTAIVTVPDLRLNPIYDDLRGEPAFQRLVS
jgi:serine/threonine-protein kinase